MAAPSRNMPKYGRRYVKTSKEFNSFYRIIKI